MTHTPNTSAAAATYTVEHTAIAGGGDRWNIVRSDYAHPFTVAAVVRLPGTLTRIYFTAGGVRDCETPAAAFAYLQDNYGEAVPAFAVVADDEPEVQA